MRQQKKSIPPNAPHVAIICTVILIGIGLIAAIVTHNTDKTDALLALLLSTIPSFGAMAYAERTSRDIRNGTVTEKARQGAEKALDNKGVTQAVTDGKETTPVALSALIRLLEDRIDQKIKQDNGHEPTEPNN